MVTFAQALDNVGYTDNGMETNLSSLNACADLFFIIAASRKIDIIPTFKKAYESDKELSLRVLQWSRDIRGGAGERKVFRNICQWLEKNDPENLSKILPKIPELGRWDDLLVFETPDIKNKAYALISKALNEGNGLCSKWMPREKSSSIKDRKIAKELALYMGLTYKDYRKLLADTTNVVETKICNKDFDTIEFGKLPSVASSRYQRLFLKKCAERYQEYKSKLVKGEAKVNASAVFPHDVIKALTNGDEIVSTAQWESLPNYLGDEMILPLVDVSGSMDTPISGGTRAMDVSIALGLYISEKTSSEKFKNVVMTFSREPSLVKLNGSLMERYSQITELDWGYNTDIIKAFTRILEFAKQNNIHQKDMPSFLLILTDMEFDPAAGGGTCFDNVKQIYHNNGYTLPKIVFWNLKGRPGNVPVKHKENGTALISGFSPSILKSVLSCSNFNPEQIMLETVMVDRYNIGGELVIDNDLIDPVEISISTTQFRHLTPSQKNQLLRTNLVLVPDEELDNDNDGC